jgi:H+/Cl- antiporter ClcA
MKIRALLTVLACNVMAFVLTSLAGFLVVLFAPWGRWAVDFQRLPPTKLAAQYGDPVALLQRGVLYHTWVIAPLIAFAVGAVAGAMLRRCDWRVSTLGIPLVIGVFAMPTSLTRALAACLYIVASWSGMKLMSLWLGRSASSPGRRSQAEGR